MPLQPAKINETHDPGTFRLTWSYLGCLYEKYFARVYRYLITNLRFLASPGEVLILSLIILLIVKVSYSWDEETETARATVFAAIGAFVTALIVLSQGQIIRKQLELQTLTNLYTEWNSKEMLKKRANSFLSIYPTDDDLEKIEAVLEFLEKLASFYRHNVLSEELVWDTFGWYILRYYFYNSGKERFPDKLDKGNIERIRSKWGDDGTLYRDLSELYCKLFKMEQRYRGKNPEELREQFQKESDKFMRAEKDLHGEYGKG